VSHWNARTVNADSVLSWRVIITASHHMAQRVWNIDAVCEFIGLLCVLNALVLGHWMQEITADLSINTAAHAAHPKLNATLPHAIFKLFSCSSFYLFIYFFQFNLWKKEFISQQYQFVNGNWAVHFGRTTISALPSASILLLCVCTWMKE